MKPTKLLLAEHAVVTYYHEAPEGVSVDDMLKPAYWAHVATQLRFGHKIEVLARDGSFWALLIVRDVGRNEASVAMLQEVQLEAEGLESETEDLYVKYRSPSTRYAVIRRSDGAVLSENHQTKEAAAQWMKNHVMAAA